MKYILNLIFLTVLFYALLIFVFYPYMIWHFKVHPRYEEILKGYKIKSGRLKKDISKFMEYEQPQTF